MNRHLSSEEIAGWAMEIQSSEARRHVAECPLCQAQLDQFAAALSSFRESARHWADECHVPNARPVPRFSRAFSYARLHSLYWAAVGLIICSAGVFSLRHPTLDPVALDSPDSDALLLQRIDSEVSQSVPSSLEPLAGLLSWQQAAQPSPEASQAK